MKETSVSASGALPRLRLKCLLHGPYLALTDGLLGALLPVAVLKSERPLQNPIDHNTAMFVSGWQGVPI